MHQVRGGQLGQVRQQHGRRVVASAHEANRNLAFRARRVPPDGRGLPAGEHVPGGGGRGALGRERVLEQHANRLEGARLQVLVHLGRIHHWEYGVDESGHLQLAPRDEVEEGLQVPLLGPANVSGRVIDAVDFVAGVIPARSVGPGEPDVELLLVAGVPRQV